MADKAFNIAKGKIAYYAGLPAANDAIIIIPIQTTGLEADATLIDYDNVSLLLAGTSDEQTTMGRKTASSVVVTIDDTNDRVDIDCADVTWTAATGNAVSALVFAYDDDTTTGTDTNLIPLSKHDWVVNPNGSDATATIAVAGFLRAS